MQRRSGGSAAEGVPLLLSVDNATPWLLERALIGVADIVDGRLAVVDAARRNRNLRVTREHGRGYLIKQPAEGDRGHASTVEIEAMFYRFCSRDAGAAALRPFVPAFVDYVEPGILVVELLDRALPLSTWYAPGVEAELRTCAAAQLGDALACLHTTVSPTNLQRQMPATFCGDAPWVLSLHRPRPAVLERISAANVQTIKILQGHRAAAAALDRLRLSWSGTAVVHNDVKGDNVLVWPVDGVPPCAVRLVDWELVQCGDPAWDVGGVFTDMWMHWISVVPFSAGRKPEDVLDSANQQLSSFFPAARAFWSAYRRRALQDRDEWAPFLQRAVQMAAARLVQTAYELAQEAATLPNASVAMLQVAVNVLDDPDTAQIHLLGIPPSLTLRALGR